MIWRYNTPTKSNYFNSSTMSNLTLHMQCLMGLFTHIYLHINLSESVNPYNKFVVMIRGKNLVMKVSEK